MRGKYSQHWRTIQKRYANQQKVKKQQEEHRQSEEYNIENPSTSRAKKKRKIDEFQALFTKVSKIMHELWLERNTDRHNPPKGQLRIAKTIKATTVVEHLYLLRSMIIPEHDSRYFAMEYSEMKGQSYTYMLKWANRWKTGIFHIMKRNKNESEGNTVKIWKMWYP